MLPASLNHDKSFEFSKSEFSDQPEHPSGLIKIFFHQCHAVKAVENFRKHRANAKAGLNFFSSSVMTRGKISLHSSQLKHFDFCLTETEWVIKI